MISPAICLGSRSSTGGRARLATWLARQLPPGLSYREPFCGVGSVLAAIDSDRPRYAADLDPNPIAMLTALRDRPREMLKAIQDFWWEMPESYTHPEEWRPWLDHWNSCLDAIDPAAAYWLRWRVGHGGRLVFATFYRSQMQRSRLAKVLTQLWAFSDRLQGVELRGGVDWESAFDQPGDAVFYLDPPDREPICGIEPITAPHCRAIDWARLSSRLRRESRPWLLTTVDKAIHRDRFIFAEQHLHQTSFGNSYLVFSNFKLPRP